jgi:hypothetical protein
MSSLVRDVADLGRDVLQLGNLAQRQAGVVGTRESTRVVLTRTDGSGRVPLSARVGPLPSLDGAFERARADIDAGVGDHEVGERALELGGVIEQAGAHIVQWALKTSTRKLAAGRADA